jgi:hypothetical protein
VLRSYLPDDADQAYELLAGRGLVDPAGSDRDLVSRAYTLADEVIVDAEPERGVRAIIALFARSPYTLWGADFAASADAPDAALAVWLAALNYATAGGWALITTRPRPSNQRARRLFESMGLYAVRGEEMETPLPICNRLWARCGDAGRIPPAFSVMGARATFSGERIDIDVDHHRGVAVARTRAKRGRGSAGHAERYTVPPSNESGEVDVVNCCAGAEVRPSYTRFEFPGLGFGILPPWWTSVAAHGLEVPARDHWPSQLADAPAAVAVEEQPRAAESGRYWLHHDDDCCHRLELYGPPNRPHARITLEHTEPFSETRDGLIGRQVRVDFDPPPTSVEVRPWDRGHRTFVNISARRIECNIARSRARRPRRTSGVPS